MNLHDAEQAIRLKVDRFWVHRALEMFNHMTMGKTTATGISHLRIPAGWPASGNITFRRTADNRQVTLSYNQRTKRFTGSAK